MSHLSHPQSLQNMIPSAITILLLFLTFLLSLFYILIIKASSTSGPKHQKLPPSPRPLPIIGNLHMLGDSLPRTLQDLAKKYGPLVSMRLGNKVAIVVSSPKGAELILKTHDTIFANRPKLSAPEYMCYGKKGVAFTEYGPYWRHVRKLCTTQFLCPTKIESFAPLRREEVGLLVESLKKAAEGRQVVDLSEQVGQVIEDITFRTVLGCKNDNIFDVKGLVEETLYLTMKFNVGDFVPFLRPLDIPLLLRMKTVQKQLDQLLEKIIGEHEQVSKSSCEQVEASSDDHKDFVDVVLSLMGQPLNPNDNQVYTVDRTSVKAILLDMITAAIDTSAIAVVWTIAELLRHPRVMKHVQQELESVIGVEQLRVEESDLGKLDYLYMVVKESFRLHPIGIIPHESMEDATIDGYHIPKNSTILFDTWTMGRDPNIWSENADEFYPERFIDSNVDLRGRDFQLLPFGSGRRACPGMQLGLNTVRLVLANLLHCFNWELPTGQLPKDLDMSESIGSPPHKAQPVLVIPTYRL